MKLQCNKCNYEFEKEKAPKRCPYCAADGSIIPFKMAQKYLDETEN